MDLIQVIKKPQARDSALRLAFANKPDYRATDALIPLLKTMNPPKSRMAASIFV
jgi:hypothetical protein